MLTDFEHAQVAFGHIIRKRNREVIQKAQRCLAVAIESFRSVSRLSVLWAPSAPWGRQRLRIVFEPLANQRILALSQTLSEGGVHRVGSSLPGRLGGIIHFVEQVSQLRRPGLVGAFFGILRLPRSVCFLTPKMH